MSEINREQKLQLVQQVRSRYHENQYDMSNRERILYGKPNLPLYDRTGSSDRYEMEQDYFGDKPFSLFRLRLIAAFLLLAAVIIMDRNNLNLAGITAEKIYEVISADYEDKIEEFVETFSLSSSP